MFKMLNNIYDILSVVNQFDKRLNCLLKVNFIKKIVIHDSQKWNWSWIKQIILKYPNCCILINHCTFNYIFIHYESINPIRILRLLKFY